MRWMIVENSLNLKKKKGNESSEGAWEWLPFIVTVMLPIVARGSRGQSSPSPVSVPALAKITSAGCMATPDFMRISFPYGWTPRGLKKIEPGFRKAGWRGPGGSSSPPWSENTDGRIDQGSFNGIGLLSSWLILVGNRFPSLKIMMFFAAAAAPWPPPRARSLTWRMAWASFASPPLPPGQEQAPKDSKA